jgi:hypothetical protein
MKIPVSIVAIGFAALLLVAALALSVAFGAVQVGGPGQVNPVVFPALTTAERNALTAIRGTVVLDSTIDDVCFYNGAGWHCFLDDAQ